MTSNGEVNAKPSFVFVKQLGQGQPYDSISFPDPFDILPNSWQYKPKDVVAPEAQESPPEGVACPHHNKRMAADRIMFRRGMHEEQRLQLRRRAQVRRALQTMSGQATLDTCCRRPCDHSVVAKGMSREKLRREEMRDVPHMLWLTKNRAATAFYVDHRRCCLLSLGARRQERVELEHYVGSSRDKLLLSRNKTRWSPLEENQGAFLSPVAADEYQRDSSNA